MAYYSRDVAKKIAALKADSYYAGFTCKSEACPLFAQCAQMPATGRKYGKNAIRVFFVFESPSQDDVAAGVPAVGEAGQYFRNKWLDAFIKEAHGSDGVQSYMITHLVRTALIDAKNATRVPTAAELAYCGEHFWADLMEFKPNAIVAFGSTAYQQLYRKAKNKKELPDPEIGVGKLREKTIEMVFTDGYKARVFVGYAAGYILRSPASEPFFIEDCNRVINHFALKKKDLSRPKVEIDNIETRDTVEGALDFIDFLTRDLPRDQWHDLAFDIETNNLNRCYNNSFLTWQFSYKKGHAVVIPITHPEKPVFSDYKDQVKLIAAFKKLLNSSPEETRIAWLVGHNLKFDLSILYGLWKIVPRGSIPIWDTMLAMHWINENRKGMGASLNGRPYSLKTLGKELFGFEYKSDAIAARADGDLVNLDFKDLVEYGGADTILTWNLKHHQMTLAAEQPDNAAEKLERFMRYYYSPATRAVALMECNGLHVSDTQLEYLQGEESPVWNRIQRIENVELQETPEVVVFREKYKKIIKGEANVSYAEDLWGDDEAIESASIFNPNKKDQETAFYLDYLQLKPLSFSKKTEKAQLNKDFLNHYAAPEVYLTLPAVQPYLEHYKKPIEHTDEGDPIFPKNPLQLILEYRELSKLGNTYLEGINDMIQDKAGDCIDGRIRASYHLAGTDTGRLSSSNPNLQNLPSGRSKMAKEVKNLFQAEPPSRKYPNGTVLIQLDYKTAEVRWAAIFAKDKNLIRLFNEAREALLKACDPNSTITAEEFEQTQLASDIHRRTASLMFGVEPAKVAKVQRQAVKSITFGLTYGMGTETLAANNGWTLEEAEEKVDMFFSAFPDLKKWLENNPKIAREKGYVETMMGRRRRLDIFYSKENFRLKAKADRLSMNAPIQGQSSDGGTIGLFQFLQFLLDNNLEKRWLVQNVVHDSCLVQVPMDDIDDALKAMQYHFVDGMSDYIKQYFGFTLPLPIECEIEVGIKYGDLTKWDGRPSTLPSLKEKLKEDAKVLWYTKKEKTGKPAKDLDLVKWQGK